MLGSGTPSWLMAGSEEASKAPRTERCCRPIYRCRPLTSRAVPNLSAGWTMTHVPDSDKDTKSGGNAKSSFGAWRIAKGT